MTLRTTHKQRTSAATKVTVFDPDKFWGQVLTGPTKTGEPDAFDARVERAWRFIRTMFFKPEEHERLRQVVARKMAGELSSSVPSQELSS